jgi:DNA invertase Pin-like site-specific DNA recombinase
MADLVYARVSTDEQSTQRQTYLLGEAGLLDGAEGVRLFSDPATSSKIPALERTGFRELASYARPGDRLIVSELFRLCRAWPTSSRCAAGASSTNRRDGQALPDRL